jgi:sporulenol synthase
MGWGWRGFQNEKLIISDIENTAVAIITMIEGNVSVNSPIIAGGVNFLIEKKDDETFWGKDTPRVIICLSKYLNIAAGSCLGFRTMMGHTSDSDKSF